MSFHVTELSQFTTRDNYNWKFYQLPEILAKNSEILGEFLVALINCTLGVACMLPLRSIVFPGLLVILIS